MPGLAGKALHNLAFARFSRYILQAKSPCLADAPVSLCLLWAPAHLCLCFYHKILFKFFFLQEAAFPVRGSHGGKMPKAQTTKAQLDKGYYSKVTRSGTANQSEKVCKMECL